MTGKLRCAKLWKLKKNKKSTAARSGFMTSTGKIILEEEVTLQSDKAHRLIQFNRKYHYDSERVALEAECL